jgi:hypothetical protein
MSLSSRLPLGLGLVLLAACAPERPAALTDPAPIPVTTAFLAGPTAHQPGVNLAVGRPYRCNVLPTSEWTVAGKPWPDREKILTDGERESGVFFWTSPRCLNFLPASTAADPVEVTIDLGACQAIAGIATRHAAKQTSGLAFPSREEYLISSDGLAFNRIAACLPPAQPATAGILEYGCSGLRTAGRFVRVRTWGSDHGEYPSYVGYDEITVAGSHDPNAVPPPAAAVPPAPLGLPAGVMGYRIMPQDWPALTRAQPLFLAPGPYAYLGDGEFHLAAGSAHCLEFVPLVTTSAKIAGVVLTCDLPAAVEVLSWHRLHQFAPPEEVRRDGRPYRRYRLEPDAGFPANHMSYPFLIVASPATGGDPDLGVCAWSWSYSLDGVAHAPGSGQLRLVAGPRLAAARPRGFLTGFWQPYVMRHFTNQESTLDRLFASWREAGFNTGFGGQGDPAVHAAGVRAGVPTISEGGVLSNGLMVRRHGSAGIPVADRFQFHPARPSEVIGVCPTLLGSDPRYAAHLQAQAVRRLEVSQHLYENWEPYMFQGRGCVCLRCKEAFGRAARLPPAELDGLWPDVVRDEADTRYTRFISQQYASIVRLLQSCVRAAGEELQPGRQAEAILALEPRYFDPASSWNRLHNPADYLPALNRICLWRYPNQIQPTTVSARHLVGNNLTSLAPMLAQVLASVQAVGRRDAAGRFLPRVIFMQGGYQLAGQQLVLPSDAAFTTLLAFFAGADGCATYEHQQKPEARYLAANARAHALIADLEPAVLGGQELPGVLVQPASPVPAQVRGRAVQTLWSRAIRGAGRSLVAIGNDHPLAVHIRLSAPWPAGTTCHLDDLAGGPSYQRAAGQGFTAADLASGVLVAIPAKAWVALEFRDGPAPGPALSAAEVAAGCAAAEAGARAFADSCSE